MCDTRVTCETRESRVARANENMQSQSLAQNYVLSTRVYYDEYVKGVSIARTLL